MNAKGHIAVGLATYATGIGILAAVGPTEGIGVGSFGLGLGAVTLGSVLPDVDTPKSTIGRMVKPFSHWLETRFGHRTITHNALFSLFWVILALSIQSPVFWALTWGIVLHIIVDSFSRQGVLWRYPFEQWEHYKNGGNYKKGRSYGKGYQGNGLFENQVYQMCWVYLSVLMLLFPWLVVITH